jgi:hypothetical protein
MGLPGMFQNIISRQKKKISDTFSPKQDRVDKNLPLGMKINGMVSFDETRFLLNEGKFLIKNPSIHNYTIRGAEKFDLNGKDIFRMYLVSNKDVNQQYILATNAYNIETLQV